MADVKMWYEAAEAKFLPVLAVPNPFGRAEFDQLLRVNAAAYYALFIAFVPVLIEAYPEIVVVLVERDIEVWYKSLDSAIIANLFNPVPQAIANLDVWFLYQISRTMKFVFKRYLRIGTKQELQEKAKPVSRKHHDSVRQLTSPKRLLNGWDPFLQILGEANP